MYLSRNTNLTRNIIQCSSFAVDDENVRGNTFYTWGVFDGHIEHGHHVSRIIRERLGQIWLDQGQHLGTAFKSMQLELDKSTVDVRCSGATTMV